MGNINTLKALLYESEKKYRSNTAFFLKDTGGAIYGVTYEKFKSDCDCLGTALIYELGAKGKNVAVFMANSYEWCVSYLAIAGGVGTVVPLDKELPCSELYNIIEFAEIAVHAAVTGNIAVFGHNHSGLGSIIIIRIGTALGSRNGFGGLIGIVACKINGGTATNGNRSGNKNGNHLCG